MNESKHNNYLLTFDKIDGVAFYTTESNLPSVNLNIMELPTPYMDIPMTGSKLVFDDFTIMFIVDEDYTNYIQILNWIVSIANPERTEGQRNPNETEHISDGTIELLSNNKNPVKSITFVDCFPINLGELTLTTLDNEIQICSLTLKYSYFKVNK